MDIGFNIDGIHNAWKLMEQASRKAADPEMKYMVESIVEQKQAKVTLGVNMAVLKTAMEMQESIIDMLA